MATNPLRTIDLHLLRHSPYLWALRLPHLFAGIAVLSLFALLAGLATTVELNDMPEVGSTYIVWLLLAALPFGYWAVLFMRIRHPVLHSGALLRAFSVVGVLAACAASWTPTVVYVTVVEARMRAVVEPVKEEILMYECVDNIENDFFGSSKPDPDQINSWILELPMDEELVDTIIHSSSDWVGLAECVGGQPALLPLSREPERIMLADEFEVHCARKLGSEVFSIWYDRQRVWTYLDAGVQLKIVDDVETKLFRLFRELGTPNHARYKYDYSYDYSRMIRVQMIRSEADIFPYHEQSYIATVLLLMGYLAYLLSFARHAPKRLFIWALVFVGGLFTLEWAFSTISPDTLRFAPIVHACVFIFGLAVVLVPEKYGKHPFLFELWLCMLPLMGISIVLWGDPDQVTDESLAEFGMLGCLATLAVSPLFHVVAERFRSRPA